VLLEFFDLKVKLCYQKAVELDERRTMMAEYIEIYWTAGSIDEARKVSRYLVQERLVASAQIIPWIESIYMWDNRLETTQESRIIFTTAFDLYDKVKEVIETNTTYEVPEITYTKLDGGNDSFLNWLQESTSIAPRK
jgi:periplasmic divalent cation tolerance protein